MFQTNPSEPEISRRRRRRRRHRNRRNPFDYAEDYLAELPLNYRLIVMFTIFFVAFCLSQAFLFASIMYILPRAANFINYIMHTLKVTYAII